MGNNTGNNVWILFFKVTVCILYNLKTYPCFTLEVSECRCIILMTKRHKKTDYNMVGVQFIGRK